MTNRYDEEVDAVLLPDGWHEVHNTSLCFEDDGDPRDGESAGFYFTGEYETMYSAPLSSLLAVRYRR